MKKNILSSHKIHRFVIVFLVVSFSAPLCSNDICAVSTKMDDLSEKKAYFSLLYDSLDLQKQIFKRNGLSVSEIERRQVEIKDSLVTLKKYIHERSAVEPLHLKKNQKKALNFLGKPCNFFDWTVVIVGIIATFSGVMLVIGIIRRLVYYRKNRKTGGGGDHSHMTPSSHARESMPLAYPEYQSNNFSPAVYDHDQNSTGSNPVVSNDPIERLRQNITLSQSVHDEKIKKQQVNNVLFHDEKKVPLSSGLEQQVLDAVREGLDIAAISRKFHLSSDHVSLIVKIGGIKKI